MHMCVSEHVECVWKSEDNFIELSFFTFTWFQGQNSGCQAYTGFYLLSHVTRPGGEFLDNAIAKAAPWGYTVKEPCDCNVTVS